MISKANKRQEHIRQVGFDLGITLDWIAEQLNNLKFDEKEWNKQRVHYHLNKSKDLDRDLYVRMLDVIKEHPFYKENTQYHIHDVDQINKEFSAAKGGIINITNKAENSNLPELYELIAKLNLQLNECQKENTELKRQLRESAESRSGSEENQDKKP